MQCEHFIYGLLNEGYQLLQTPGVNKLLDDTNLRLLAHIGDNVADETYIIHYLPQQKLLSYSHITPATDKYGRTGIRNHTVLIPITQLIEPLTTIFNTANNLEPITLEIKVKP